jgi:hypothetical protein
MTLIQRRLLYALVALSVLVSVWVLLKRVQAEAGNRAVGIAVDFGRVQELALLQGVDPVDALKRLKAAGATHVAVREDSLMDLIELRQVEIAQRADGVLLRPRPLVRRRVVEQLAARMPGGKVLPDGDGVLLADEQALDSMRLVGMGYDERSMQAARDSGLRLIARPVAEMALSPRSITASLDAVQAMGADMVIFAGTQVYGMYDLIKWAAQQLEGRGIRFGYVEMAKQFGDDRMAAALHGNVIRCHAIAQAEMPKLTPQRAIDRYRQAVRERNVRLCYFRPYDQGSEDPLQTAVEHVTAIAADVRASGFSLRDPHFFTDPGGPGPLLPVLLVGVGAATLLLADLLLTLPAGLAWWLLAAVVVLSPAASLVARGLAQSLGGLAAAIVFPSLALCRLRWTEPGGRLRLGPGIGLFLVTCCISLLGGLLSAGCLSDLAYMMQISAFRGVKFAQVIPLGLVLAVFAARSTRAYEEVRTETGPGLSEWPALWAGIVEVAGQALKYWQVGVLLVAMAAAALMLMRSGNVTPVPPSAIELKVRAIMDRALIVRPRTKEILLGHPALVLTLAFLLAGRRRFLWVGMLCGAVGQVGLVNSFGHIHTTFALTLLRVFNGLWIGVVVAVIVWMVAAAVCRAYERHTARAAAGGAG